MNTCKTRLMIFSLWISLIFQIKLCLGINKAINIYYTAMFTIRSGVQLPLICYLAVADRFTRPEITYIQVALPPYLKLRDVVKSIIRVPLISRHIAGFNPYIFNCSIGTFVFGAR